MYSLQSIKSTHKIWFFSFLLSNVLVIALGMLVNPYRLLPISITIVGINDIKPKLYDYQRYVKLFDIAQQKPKTVLLGSSRILWGLDPKNTLLSQKGYLPVYNAGILGPPMYEIRKYFEHALQAQPHLKRVILGIDFFAFNQAFDGRTLLKDYGKNNLQLLLSNFVFVYDLKAVYLTLQDSLLRRLNKSLRVDGRLTPNPIDAPKLYEDFFRMTEKKVAAGKKNQNLYVNFKISKIDMDALRYIVATCKSRNIDLHIFITPINELAAYHEYGIWQAYITFLRRLAAMHPYWDFLTLNEVMLNKNNFIHAHFVFSVGDMILKRMLAPSDAHLPKSFGQYVTADNVDRFVKDLEKDYEQSIKNV